MTIIVLLLPHANPVSSGLCGAWNARDPGRAHERGGTTPTSVVMGGQRLPIRRPRVHAVGDNGRRAGEVPLATYGVVAQGDMISRVAVERMLAEVATRGFERAGDPIGAKARSAARALDELLGRDLLGLGPAVLMIDGVNFAGDCCVVALTLHRTRGASVAAL